MFYKSTGLEGYELEGRDGHVGRVKDFYFDDSKWAVRYLVADTGNWLTGRQVLISPHAVKSVNVDTRQLVVNLTKKQVEDSPSAEQDQPISRQFESDYYGYYGYPQYWTGPFMWGAFPYAGNAYGYAMLGENRRNESDSEKEWDYHLRSINEVTGHHILATDGEIGHVEEFILDDQTWAIRYLVVDTKNWWPGKKVLISPRWIDGVSWIESKVFTSLTRDAVKRSPEYTDDLVLSREYETELHRTYDRHGYWMDEEDPARRTVESGVVKVL